MQNTLNKSLPTVSALVREVFNYFYYFFRFSGFSDLFGKVFLINLKFCLLDFSAFLLEQCKLNKFSRDLKAHSQVWDNFGQLKALKNDEKCFLFHFKSSFRSQCIVIFALAFWSYRTAWLERLTSLISKFMTFNLGNKQLKYKYCPTSQEVKAIR